MLSGVGDTEEKLALSQRQCVHEYLVQKHQLCEASERRQSFTLYNIVTLDFKTFH